MPQLYNKISFLLGEDKVKEAIAILDQAIKGPLEKFKSKFVSLKSDFIDLENRKSDGLINNENYRVAIANIKLKISDLTELIDNNQINTEDLDPLITSNLIQRDSFPFLDRLKFRRKIKNIVLSQEPGFVFIEGRPKSGLTYIGKYLNELVTRFKLFELITVDMKILDVPEMSLGELLASYMLSKLNCDKSNFENDQFKFVQFINALQAKLESEDTIPIFFLHDFHKIDESNTNLLDFIFHLLSEIKESFPKCIFILTGLNYRNIRNWQHDLKFLPTINVYKMEDIGEEDIKGCLEHIFEKYETCIHELYKEKSAEAYEAMQKDDYINGFVEQLKLMSLPDMSNCISNHLLDLKDFQ